jgi:hypothetical protein
MGSEKCDTICHRLFLEVYKREPTLDDKHVMLLMALTYTETRKEQIEPKNVDVHLFVQGAAWMFRRLRGADLTERETEAAQKAALNGKL